MFCLRNMNGNEPVQRSKKLQYEQRNKRQIHARLSNNCTKLHSAWMRSTNRQATKKYGEIKAQLHFHTKEQKIPTAVGKNPYCGQELKPTLSQYTKHGHDILQ